MAQVIDVLAGLLPEEAASQEAMAKACMEAVGFLPNIEAAWASLPASGATRQSLSREYFIIKRLREKRNEALKRDGHFVQRGSRSWH